MTARILGVSSATAFRLNRLDDAAILMLAAQMRVWADNERFVARRHGGASSAQFYVYLKENAGRYIFPALAVRPKLFHRVVELAAAR